MATHIEPVDSEEEESIYDERLAVRRLAFRNCESHPQRIMLPLDQSTESLTLLGPPAWLVGSYFALVPAVFDVHYWASRVRWAGVITQREKRPMRHLSDCLCLVVHLEFLDSGQVQFRSQLLAPGALDAWRSAQGNPDKIDGRHLAQVLAERRHKRGWWEAMISPRPSDINPEAVVVQSSLNADFPMGPYRGADRRLVLHQTGGCLVQLLDPTSLRPRPPITYLDLNRAFEGIPTPNPRTDFRTREVLNVLVEYKRPAGYAKYNVVTLVATTEAFQDIPHVGRVIGSFLAPPTRLQHFAITEEHVIIPIDAQRYMNGLPNFGANLVDGVEELLQWDEHADTLFYVVSRGQGQLVAVYRSEPSLITAVVNAFEEGGALFVDVVAGEGPPSGPKTLEELRDARVEVVAHERPFPGTLRRYCLFRLGEEIARFDGAAGQLPSFPLALYHHLTDYSLNNPIVNSNIIGTGYRHVYGLAVDRDSRGRPGVRPNALVKCDLASPARSLQWHRSGTFPSPPIFVPRADLAYGGPTWARSLAEDDGVLITIVLDVFAQRSYAVVLDAKDLRELARFFLPRYLPIATSTPIWCPNRAALPAPFSPIGTTGGVVTSMVEPVSPEKTALLPKEQH